MCGRRCAAGRNVAEGAVDENGLPQSQNGVTMEENAAAAPAFGQEPRREWAKGGLVSPRQGSVAAYEQQVAADYGVPSFVVRDSVWDQYKKGDAFTTGGQIYLRETIDEDKSGRVAAHEINHVMRQVGFEPYLAFLDALPDMLDIHNETTQKLFAHIFEHTGIDPLDMTATEGNRFFDELNATIYGYIATTDTAVLSWIQPAFLDWDGYTRRIQEIHREFKERDGGHGQETVITGMARGIEKSHRRDSQEGENAGGEGTYGTVQEVLGGTGVSGNRGRLRGVGEGVSLQQGQPAVIHATGQEVTVTGIGRTDGNGSVQMSLSDGTQMDLADLGFENPAVKELVVAASEYPTAAARAFTSGYDGSTPLSLYHSGFDYLYQQAINGMPLEQAVATSGEIGQMLSPQVQYLAYTAGRNVAEGTFEDTYVSSSVEQNDLPNLGNDDMIKNVTKDEAQPAQDSGRDGDGPSEEDLENSRKNIREFANGRKTFGEVIDDYAKLYADKVNSNKHWSWRKLVVGGNKLTKGQRQAVKMEAIAKGYIPDIKIIKVDGMKFGYADFESAGVVKLTMELPESMWKKSDSSQFKWLDKQIGGHIEGYTWHHTEIPGKMQLVPRGLHNITAHNGGRTKGMWASGKR